MKVGRARKPDVKLSEVVIEQVDSSVLYQVHAREFHDLSDFLLEPSLVALALALLAHRFRVVRAREPHTYAAGQKPLALGAEENLFILDLPDIQLFQGKGVLRSLVPFTAVNGDKTDQSADVRFFLW